MHRSSVVLLLICALALAGCHEPDPGDPANGSPTDGASPPPTGGGPHIFTDSFEGGLDSWANGSHVPDDPNEPGEKVDWNISISDGRAQDGDQSVNFTIDGRQDDGTIWIVRPIEVEPGLRYETNVTAYAWSASESFNTIAHFVTYLGTEPPEREESFPRSGESGPIDDTSAGQRTPLDVEEGWREYSFEWETPATENGTLYVALGISVVWETHMTYFADDVRVTLDPVRD